jgi:hypothetical protein
LKIYIRYRKMSGQVFQKKQNSSYFTIGDMKEDATSYSFSGKGIVIDTNTKEISLFGGASKIISKTRAFNVSLKSLSNATINGDKLVSNVWQWTDTPNMSLTSTFSLVKGQTLFLEADTTGFVIYQSDNDLIAIAFDFNVELVAYGTKVDKGYTAVWFNGEKLVPASDLFDLYIDVKSGKNHDTLTLRPHFTRTEQFYVEYASKVVEFPLDKIDFGDVKYVIDTPSIDETISHFRCVWKGTDTTSGVMSVVRSNGLSENVPLRLVQIDNTIKCLERVIMPFYHKNQKQTFNFSSYTNIIEIRDNKQARLTNTLVDVNGPTTYTIKLRTGETFSCHLCPVLIPYTETTNKRQVSFGPQTKAITFRSQTAYMINGNVYPLDEISQNCSAETACKGEIKLTMDQSIMSYGTYDGTKWTITPTQIQTQIDTKYDYNVFDTDSTIIDMKDFGVKSDRSVVKYYIVGKSAKDLEEIVDGKYKLTIPDSPVPGRIIQTTNFCVVVDTLDYRFKVDFRFETLQRLSFAISGNSDFQGNVNMGSMKKRSFDGKFFFGNFVQLNGMPLSAYNVVVDSNCNIDSCYLQPGTFVYPTITFLADNIGTFKQHANSYPVQASILKADQSIPFQGTFVKMNHCNDVSVGKNAITIPKGSATCLFRADNTIYLFCPETPTSVAYRIPSAQSSAASSANTTPRDDSSLTGTSSPQAPTVVSSPMNTSNAMSAVASSSPKQPPVPPMVVQAKTVVPVADVVQRQRNVPIVGQQPPQRPVVNPNAKQLSPPPVKPQQTIVQKKATEIKQGTRPVVLHYPGTKHLKEHF